MDTMEIKQLIKLLQRWGGLLILGLSVGLLAGLLVGRLQKPTYRATTQLLVTRDAQSDNSSFAGLNNQQLTQTYVQILRTKHLRDETSERVGFGVGADQVSVQLVPDTQIVEIKVEDHDPGRAAEIANTMVYIIIEENDATQAGQYSASESNLAKQIAQVEERISSMQSEYDQIYKQDYQNQLSQVDEKILAIQAELTTLQTEIAELSTPSTVEGRAQLSAMEMRVAQLQSSYKTYDDLRANLVVLRRPIQTTLISDDPYLRQMKSTIDLYQQIYLNLLTSLETTRLARLKHTPNIVQIEEAFVPEKPVRPVILLYIILSGMVGLVLAGMWIFYAETLKDSINQPETPGEAPKRRGSVKINVEP